MKNSVKTASVYIGTFIGAGFASGQEILRYFAVYGTRGALGAVLSGIIFGLFCYCSMYSCRSMGNKEFLKAADFSGCMGYVFCAFMILMFCTMSSACGELFFSIFGLPRVIGAAVMALSAALFLNFGEKGVVRLNLAVTPIIIVGILLVCTINIYRGTVSTMAGGGYLTSSVLYVAYNAVTLSGITAGVERLIDGKRTALLSAVMCGLVLGGLILAEWAVLYNTPCEFSEIPVLDLLSEKYALLYFPVLFLAMLTTAVSNGYGVTCRFRGKKTAIIALCTAAVCFSAVRFSFIVKNLYRLFGYIGIAVLVNILVIFLKVRKSKKNIEIPSNNKFFRYNRK